MHDTSDEIAVAATLIQAIQNRPVSNKPFLVALDGRSGTGKSTLAAVVAQATGACVIDQDDFYADGTLAAWQDRSAAANAAHVIDTRRLRTEALEPLLRKKPATWHPFDWDAMHGLAGETVGATASEVIILEGTYSSRPELADLYDMSVLIRMDEAKRLRWLTVREGDALRSPWQTLWDEAEVYYFTHIRPASAFDLVITR